MDGSNGRDIVLADRDGHRVSMTQHKRGQSIARHDHRHACMHMILAGIYVELGSDGARLALPGDLLFKPAGASHANLFGAFDARSVRIESRGLESAPASLLEREATLARCPSAGGPHELWRLSPARSRALDEPARLDAMVREAVAGLSREVASTRDHHPPSVEARAAAWITRRHAEPIRIAVLSADLGIDRSVLARRFRNRFCCSMRQYVTRRRIAHVVDAITHGGAPLSRAFIDAGFCDQSHGTRAFTATLGMPPRAWSNRAHASLRS